MIKEGKIGVQEGICLVMIATGNKIFFSTPGFLTRFVGTAGWLMTLISCTFAIVFFTFIYLLLKRFPRKNIIEIYDISLGRAIGFVFSFIFAVAFLLTSGILLREFTDVIKVFTFPNTPPSVINGVFIIVIVAAAFLGLESIARVAKLTAYVALFGYILLLSLAWQNFKLTNLFPILGYGLDMVIFHGFMRSSAYAEVIVLAVFASSLQGIKHIKKVGYISLCLSGLILSSGLLCMSLVFSYYTSQELIVPLYIMARLMKYGDFIQRLDPIFLFLWIITSIITFSILFYCTVSVYCKTFRLQDTRPVIIPMAVLLFTVIMIPKDFASVVGYIQSLGTYGIVVFYVLPLIALIVSVLRKKKGEKSNA